MIENCTHCYLKNKKASRRGEKLFIGLTTKPCYELQSRSENNTTFLNAFLSRRTALEETFIGQKRFSFLKTFSQFSGLDGTRTRDPMRDRHVF
jgi:hypothetical protein